MSLLLCLRTERPCREAGLRLDLRSCVQKVPQGALMNPSIDVLCLVADQQRNICIYLPRQVVIHIVRSIIWD